MDSPWSVGRASMDYRRTIHGQSMDSPWTARLVFMEWCAWAVRGQSGGGVLRPSVDSSWTIRGVALDSLRIFRAQVMANPWTVREPPVDTLRAVRGVSMG